jgi:hypothetical protein
VAAYEVLLLNTAIPQIQAAQSGDTYVVPRDIAINATAIISANSATDALRITQTGAGNAILVEDSANPDSTPFVVTAAGDVGIGTSSPSDLLHLNRNTTTATVQRITNTGGTALIGVENADGTGIISGAGAYDTVIRTASGTGVSFGIGYSPPAMRLNPSGNLGLGVTPSTWASNFVAMQIGPGATVNSASDGRAAITSNIFIASGPTAKYIANGFGAAYTQLNGAHLWFTAPNNTSGPNIDASGGSTTMTLDASGNLVVGATSTSSRFEAVAGTGAQLISTFRTGDATAANNAGGGFYGISSATAATRDATLWLDADGANFAGGDYFYIQKFGNSGVVNIVQYSNAAMTFYTDAAERARITSGGYFKASNDGTYQGITGTFHEVRQSASDIALHIGNTAASAPEGILVRYNAASPNNTSSAFLFCVDSTATRATIRSNGGLANYQANNVDLSDIRTKKEIASAASMWDKVAALEIVEYKYIDQTHDDVNLGVIAQQVETVEPVWVDTDGFGETPEGEEPLKTVYNKDIYFAAIKALQEAMTRIEQLEAKVAALQGA